MRAALIIAVIALFSDASADTVGTRVPNPPTTKVTVTKTSRFTPVPLVTTPFTPELDANAIMSNGFLSGTIRKEQEQILLELIKHTPDTEVEEKADYLFRLGELYAKQRWQATDPAAKADALGKLKATYKKLFDNPAFKNYPRLDMALFFYGYSLPVTEAKPVLDRLVKEFPNSKYAPDAYLVMADAEFAANQLVDADMNYGRVLKWPRPQSAYARYKRGYIELAQQKASAQQAFLELLDILLQDSTSTQQLLDATRTGLVRAMVQQNKIDLRVFQKADADHAIEDMQNLAQHYAARGKHEQAAAAYRELIKAQPANDQRCTWQLEAAKAAAVTAPKVEVCTSDVDAFKQWAQRAGLDVK